MKRLRVAVHGAAGRMGREVIRSVWLDPELEIVGAVEQGVTEDHLLLPDGSSEIFYDSDLRAVIERCYPEVLVDFSVAEAARGYEAVRSLLLGGKPGGRSWP